MTNSRSRIRGTYAAGALFAGFLFAGFLALSATYTYGIVAPPQPAGISVHAKNDATPDWMLELQTRDAGELPITVQSEEPSFWI